MCFRGHFENDVYLLTWKAIYEIGLLLIECKNRDKILTLRYCKRLNAHFRCQPHNKCKFSNFY